MFTSIQDWPLKDTNLYFFIAEKSKIEIVLFIILSLGLPILTSCRKGSRLEWRPFHTWFWIEFTYTLCALNANWVYIDHVHTTKLNCNWIAVDVPHPLQLKLWFLPWRWLYRAKIPDVSKCTEVCPNICLTLSLVDFSRLYVECEFWRTTWDHLVSDLFFCCT